MLAIQLVSYGNPTESLVCADVPEPGAPAARQVLVEMMYAPIGPTDLFLAEGHFGKGLPLPSVIGGEGIGVVRKLGPDVDPSMFKVGDRVLVPAPTPAWAQRVLAPANDLVYVPRDADAAQASMLAINPATASLLLSEFTQLKPGDWVLQNAANSGVGRSVIAFAKQRGLKTINLVRRPELIDELVAAGADIVLLNSDDVASAIKGSAAEGRTMLALDGIGGRASETLSRALSSNGHLVAYVAIDEPMVVDAQKVIFNSLVIGGFFIYQPKYAAKLKAARVAAVELVREKHLHVPVVATFPLHLIKEAVQRAQQGGKVLLDFTK